MEDRKGGRQVRWSTIKRGLDGWMDGWRLTRKGRKGSAS